MWLMTPAIQSMKIQKRWVLEKIDWDQWRRDLPVPNIILPNTVDNINEDIVTGMLATSEKNIPQTSGEYRTGNRSPWWSEDLSRKIAERRRARRKLEKHPLLENLQDYNQKRNIAKAAINEAKKKSWQSYISDIKSDTPTSVVWSKIRSMKNKSRITSIPIINNNEVLSNTQEKVECLAKHFKSLDRNETLADRRELEQIVEISCLTQDENDRDLIYEELCSALEGVKQSSLGKDQIVYKFLQELPDNYKKYLLYLYNTSYITATISVQWKESKVIPILKPGKDSTSVSAYRPIALLSCVGKVMERIIKNRLDYEIEKRASFQQSQCGFRKGMSTIDALIRVNETIKSALQHKQYCIVVYLDLESAFDKVSHTAVLYKMALMGYKGKLLNWLRAYLAGRYSKVRLHCEYSQEYSTENGVPQGAVLSPTLFNFMMCDLPSHRNVNVYSYADDVTFAIKGTSVAEIKREMQIYLRMVEKWLEKWRVKINQGKTVMQVFTRKRDYHVSVLRLNGQVIKVVSSHKLLGVHMDAPKLTWHEHIDILAQDCIRRLDLMKSLASTTWGASRKMLRMFYVSYIRSKLEYGCELFSNASDGALDKIVKIQNVALRLITGA